MSVERADVEAAYRHFVEVGDSGDWDAWADLHTDDGLWLEHSFGEIRGREEIRSLIKRGSQPGVSPGTR